MAINRLLNTISFDFIDELPIVGNRNEQYWVNENQSFYHYINGIMTRIENSSSLSIKMVATAKTADYTAKNGDFVLMSPGATDKTAYMPLNPRKDDRVDVCKVVGGGSGSVPVDGNGKDVSLLRKVKPIQIIKNEGDCYTLQYTGVLWIVK